MQPEQTATNRAVLSFKTAAGTVGRFSIPRAVATKPFMNALSTMERMVNSGALEFKAGAATQPYGAKIVNTVRTRIV